MASSNHRDDFVVIQTIFPPHWAVADNLCTESVLHNYDMHSAETKKVLTIKNRSFPVSLWNFFSVLCKDKVFSIDQ